MSDLPCLRLPNKPCSSDQNIPWYSSRDCLVFRCTRPFQVVCFIFSISNFNMCIQWNLDLMNLYLTKSSIITKDTLRPGQNYSKMYGIEPQYNEPRCNEFLDITNIIQKPKLKIYLDIMIYNVNRQQKINAEHINSQQIL